jgi:hypothetical protein
MTDHIEWPRRQGYPEYRHADYLDILRPEKMRTLVEQSVDALSRKEGAPEFDTVAFTGASGFLIAPQVALALGKQMIMVRKEETDHSPYRVEGYAQSERYIMLDDFLATGSTLKRAITSIKGAFPRARCVGFYLYRDHNFIFGANMRWYFDKDFYENFYSEDKIEAAVAVAESDDPTVVDVPFFDMVPVRRPFVGVVIDSAGKELGRFGGPDKLSYLSYSLTGEPPKAELSNSDPPSGDDEHACPF